MKCRRAFATVVSALFLFASVALAGAAAKPNLVFILIDDLGWADLGCYGSTFYETPNLDKLAAQGARFTQAYAACPVCSPTRGSIQTGKYPVRVGVTDFIGRNQPEEWTRNTPLLPASYRPYMLLEETTIAEALKAGGYTTGFFGKWHLGSEPYWPEKQGCDVNKGGCDKGATAHFPPYKLPNLPDGPKGEYLADRLTDEAIKFIEANKDRPFLAYLAHYDVHTPLGSKPAVVEKYRKKAAALGITDDKRWRPQGGRKDRRVQDHAVYGAMMECLDDSIGRVLARLDVLKLADDTIIFFTSDNGGLSTSEGSPTANAPLRAGKGWLYEGGIREPLLVKWPGVIKPGTVIAEPVISPDLYPAILELTSLPSRPQQHVDGVSLVPLLKGAAMSAPRPLFWHYPHYGNQGGFPGAAIRSGDWKLIESFEDHHAELYNIRDDIGEDRDLAAKMPDKVNSLRDQLHAWQKQIGAKFPGPNPKYKPGKRAGLEPKWMNQMLVDRED